MKRFCDTFAYVCVCVCLCVFMSVGSHRGTQVAQSPLGWGDNLSRPLAMINLPPHKSREKWKKRRKRRWKWQKREMKQGEEQGRETSQERDSGEGGVRDAGGQAVDARATLSGSSHTHIYPSEFLIRILSQDTSHSSLPGRSLWARLRQPPDYEVPRNSPLYQVKTHSSKPSSSVWTSSYPSVATKDLSLVCLFVYFSQIGVLRWFGWTLPTSKSNNQQ